MHGYFILYLREIMERGWQIVPRIRKKIHQVIFCFLLVHANDDTLGGIVFTIKTNTEVLVIGSKEIDLE